jgi:hypothetical protein
MRLFTSLATSRLMRGPLLKFYASVSDHTRRLVSVRANAKFGSADAGPDHSLNVSLEPRVHAWRLGAFASRLSQQRCTASCLSCLPCLPLLLLLPPPAVERWG